MFLEPWVTGGGASAGVPGVCGSRSVAGQSQSLRAGADPLCVGPQRPQGAGQLHHNRCR